MSATRAARGKSPLRVVAWGTYDLGKPRVRILLRGLRENGVEVIECHQDVWRGIEDKSQVSGWRERLRLAAHWLLAYPALVWCYLRAPRHDAVLIPYLGQLDILILWPFAKLRRQPLILDAFLSLYNTVVEDRRLISKRNPIAWLLFAWEWLACHAANRLLVDTNAHGAYFCATFGLDAKRIQRVFVGVEPERFPPPAAPSTPKAKGEPLHVLFYGQFIPLHGIDTVVRAAKLTEADNIHWHLIGTGQEAPRIESLIAELRPTNLTWTRWVPYEQLIDQIHAADLCLGIFGATDKAARVIPNKVFQILAAGTPLITRDSPAMRELVQSGPAVRLIAAEDPHALAHAVSAQLTDGAAIPPEMVASIRGEILPATITRPLADHFNAVD